MHHALVVPDRNVILVHPPVPDMHVVIEQDRLMQPVHNLTRLDPRQAVDPLDVVSETVDGVPLSPVSPK